VTNIPYSSFDIFGAFIIALVLSYCLTPLFKMTAMRLNFFDHPEIKKKSHAKPIPLLGGVAIFTSFFLAVLFSTRSEEALLPVFLGALVLVVFGLIDDRFGMMPNVKLAAQFIAALIVIRMGIRVDTIQNHYLSLIFTVVWIVGITNAFNLLDNLNGLSSGIAGIAGVFFGIIALHNGQFFTAVISFALAGACFGFLKHNFPRAHIFMGDTGSMFIGFILSCIAIIGTWKTDKISISLSLPILILSYPIFDTLLVTIIRIIEGRSIFQGGRDHSSHILALLGFKKKRAVILIFFIAFYTGVCAYMMSISSVAVGFAVMILAYLFLLILGLYLLSVRITKARKTKKYIGHGKKAGKNTGS